MSYNSVNAADKVITKKHIMVKSENFEYSTQEPFFSRTEAYNLVMEFY